MKRLPTISVSICLLTAACLFATGQSQAQQAKSQPKATQTASSANLAEQRFQANCSRCHNPPQTLSPREARTVIRHMRVRAMLSAEDARLILQYLAP